MKLFGILEDEAVCMNCKYFYQHYILEYKTMKFTPCNAGHCWYPRLKSKKPNDTCAGFTKEEQTA